MRSFERPQLQLTRIDPTGPRWRAFDFVAQLRSIGRQPARANRCCDGAGGLSTIVSSVKTGPPKYSSPSRGSVSEMNVLTKESRAR